MRGTNLVDANYSTAGLSSFGCGFRRHAVLIGHDEFPIESFTVGPRVKLVVSMVI